MSILKQLHQLLGQHGLWPEEITEVLQRVQNAPENESMTGRWNDNPSAYPSAIMNLMWSSAKTHAVKYLQQTKPAHFALALLK